MIARTLAFLALLACLSSPAASAGPAPSMVAGGFSLRTADGRTVDSNDLVGTPYGIFFGFLSCPDVCPTTLADLSGALAALPPAAEALRIYFVSVDPADRLEDMRRYTSVFDHRIVPLGGERAAIEEAIRSFGIVVRRSELADGSVAYGHTAAVMLVDGDGVIVDRTSMQDDADRMLAKLRALVP